MKFGIGRLAGVLVLCAVNVATSGGLQDENCRQQIQLLADGQRVVFLGDSITYAGDYVAIFDVWVSCQGPKPSPTVINVGLPSETVSGLSEEGHAGGRFPRPDLNERLDRVLDVTKPNLVIACYGINCGIYQPFSSTRFAAFQKGIINLRTKVEQAGAKLILLTPPSYDDARSKNDFSYNDVLQKYASWLIDQKQNGWMVVDLHSAMDRRLDEERRSNPEFTFQPDAVHPNVAGHWLIASELIRWFGDDVSADKASPAEMISHLGRNPTMVKKAQRRMVVLRDAYLDASKHKRPGIPAGLPLEQALEQANKLSTEIEMLANEKRFQK